MKLFAGASSKILWNFEVMMQRVTRLVHFFLCMIFIQGILTTGSAQETKIEELGPSGSKAAPLSMLKLTDRDEEKLFANTRAYKVAIVMHYLSSNWSQLQVKGMKSIFNRYGIKVLSVSGADYKLDEHMMNIERAIALKPDAILSIVVNENEEGPVYRKISENGIHLILLDMLPIGLKHPRDYSCLISSTNRLNGAFAADIMAEQMGNKGKVGILKLAFPHYVTEQRVKGFRERLRKKYPRIRIIDEAEFGDDEVTMEDAYQRTEELLIANPDMNGLFAVWIEPALAAGAAATALGKSSTDFTITTSDLEEAGALEIAKKAFIKGTGAQDPFAQGQAEAYAAIKAILGYDLPPFFAVPGLKITRKNLIQAYRQIMHTEPPEEIRVHYKK